MNFKKMKKDIFTTNLYIGNYIIIIQLAEDLFEKNTEAAIDINNHIVT